VAAGGEVRRAGAAAEGGGAEAAATAGRGLHSSTFRLNQSAFCGIGGAFRGFVGVLT
jgi:hypothetical protein